VEEKLAISKDLIILSGIAGFIGTLFKIVYSGIPYLLNITQDYGIIIAGRIIFHAKDFPLSWGHIILATLTHLLIGSVIGIGLGIVYYLSGKDFYLLKGGLFGLAIWFILRNTIVSMTTPGGPQEIDAITTAVSFTSHIFYGFISGYIITKYSHFVPST
jgi:hypothetical protein